MQMIFDRRRWRQKFQQCSHCSAQMLFRFAWKTAVKTQVMVVLVLVCTSWIAFLSAASSIKALKCQFSNLLLLF